MEIREYAQVLVEYRVKDKELKRKKRSFEEKVRLLKRFV